MLQTPQPIIETKSFQDEIGKLRFDNWIRRNTVKSKVKIENQITGMIRGWIIQTEQKNIGDMDDEGKGTVKNRSDKVKKTLIRSVRNHIRDMEKDPTLIMMNPVLDPTGLSDDRDIFIANGLYKPLFTMIRTFLILQEDQKYIERKMYKTFETFPVYQEWVQTVRGVSGGLSYVIGDTGDLWNYDNPSKVWKRMGLAVINGERQGNNLTGNAEKAAIHGYNKYRRSQMYQIGESLIKGNTKEGKYKIIYDTRKEYEYKKDSDKGLIMLKPGQSYPVGVDKSLYSKAGIRALRAQRIMEKELLKDFWIKWRETMPNPND